MSTTTFAASTALTTSFAQVTGALTVVAGTTWGRVDILIGGPTSGRTASVDGVRLVATGVGTGLDYAENYPADPSNIPQPGDVVSLDNLGNLAEVTLAGKPMDDSVIGVVSTNPGEVLGPDVPDPKVAVALSGRTPVKVSSENGPIQIGDYLASSDIPGVAVKAITAGPVIGVAMENYANPDPANIGSITAFIKNTYYNGGSLASNTGLTSENGKDIILPLAANGSFIIKNSSGASLAMFNANGNATFSGTLTVDNLKTNQIAGLDIISNQLADLTNQVASLSANLAVLSASTQSASLPQASMSSLLNLADLNVNGLATVSADLSVGGNGLIQGALSVLNNITTQNLLVSQFAYFINDVVFRGNVRFNSPPTFNSDTAGFAVIKKDSDNVQVAFTQEYADVPVVTASIALNKLGDDAAQKQLEDAVLNGNLSFVLTQRTTKGFVIRLNKPSPEDINFSWIALSIKDAKVSGLDSLPAVIPTATNSAAFQSIINQLNNSSGNGGGG